MSEDGITADSGQPADLREPDANTPSDDGRRTARLDRAAILESAIALIDREGLRHLTMRRLGAWCGVEAMALYRYVSGRDDLLSGVVDLLVDRLYQDNLIEQEHDAGSWQNYLQRLAHGVRHIALDHPEVFPLLTSQPPQAPWLCPPLRSLNWMESFLGTLLSYGFDDSQAVAVYRSFANFLLGHLLLEVVIKGADLGPVPSPETGEHSSADLTNYPHLRRLQSKLSENHAAAEFEESLENLLDRLETLRSHNS